MKYRFIQEHAGRCRIKMMCAILGVSRSGYYVWRKPGPGMRASEPETDGDPGGL